MVLFKCKACGGDIRPNEDGITGKCEYCGTIQTLPKDKDEKISQILNRANDFRLNCDFDRAIFEYEKVLELDEAEPEAHWGIFLSKYGVEYVKDTMTLAYKPTLHRISSTSVYDDMDYQATLKYASLTSAEQYKADAAIIEAVMKELLLLSANQESYDIFLSYKELDDITRQRTDDSYLAHDLYNELTAQGYKVFFAPKSLIGVSLYEPKIYSAIISSKVMIVLGTKAKYLEGVWVKNEWSRFAEAIEHGEDKVLIPVFKNMEASELPNRIAKYQAYDMTSMTFIEDVKKVISLAVKKQSNVSFDKNASAEDAFIERGFIALEDRDFTKADSFFENALNLNPHNSQAYFGKLMVEMRISKQEQILTSSKPLKEYANFEKAVRFADQQQKTVLLQYEEKLQYTLDEQVYNKAIAIISKEGLTESDYCEAAEIFNSIIGFKDAKEQKQVCRIKIEELKEKAESERIRFAQKVNESAKLQNLISVGRCHTVGLKPNGMVVAVGSNKKGQCNISKWANIVAISAGTDHTVGLKSDKTVVAVGSNKKGQCNISKWANIVAVSAGAHHTVGLKSDGTVVATKIKIGLLDVPHGVAIEDSGQCNVSDWKDIVAISAGLDHTVGLKSDGTVIATKYIGDMKYYRGQCEVYFWKDIVAISAGFLWHTVGLKSNGKVVAVGYNNEGQCNVSDWKDIVAISAGHKHTVGLKSDGTVVAVGSNDIGQCNVSDWKDIVAISAGSDHTVGLKSDGTVVATKYIGDMKYYKGQCEVENWKLV